MGTRTRVGALLFLALAPAHASTQERMLLWPEDQAPGFRADAPEEETNPGQPTLDVYLPEGSVTGTAVVICPGGGYGSLAMQHEGRDIARWFAARGVAGFVLRYRHAPAYRHPVPLGDAWRALRTVRAHAAEYGVATDRIGVMGFSAGGHLASLAATHFDPGDPAAADPVERVSCRPDFAILCYPVILMSGEAAHGGSRRNLLGAEPGPAALRDCSTDLQVTARTPPTFLFHTNADTGVPAENSIAFYLACRRAGVDAELHVFEPGRHGVGLAPGDARLGAWPTLLAGWMAGHGWVGEG